MSSHTQHRDTPLTGKLFVLVGPPGAGKNTLMSAAIAQAGVRQLPTATTRAMRPNEQEGVQHFFVTKARFMEMIANDELLEYQQVHRNEQFYGIVREPLDTALADGEYLVADIEINGAEIVRNTYPDNAIAVFISVRNLCDLKARMGGRNETDAEIARRMLRVPLEMAYMNACPYVIINDDPKRASAALISLIEAVRADRSCQLDRPAAPQFRYEVEFVITCEDQQLVRAGTDEGVVIEFRAPDFPHRAAPALTAHIGVPGQADAVVGGSPIEPDGFLPPIDLLCRQDSECEIVRYRYHYPITTRVAAPPGWEWRAAAGSAQPPAAPDATPVNVAQVAYA